MAGTESDEKRSLLRPSLGVGAVTLISRLLGLVRVRLEASVLGGGRWPVRGFLRSPYRIFFAAYWGRGLSGRR